MGRCSRRRACPTPRDSSRGRDHGYIVVAHAHAMPYPICAMRYAHAIFIPMRRCRRDSSRGHDAAACASRKLRWQCGIAGSPFRSSAYVFGGPHMARREFLMFAVCTFRAPHGDPRITVPPKYLSTRDGAGLRSGRVADPGASTAVITAASPCSRRSGRRRILLLFS